MHFVHEYMVFDSMICQRGPVVFWIMGIHFVSFSYAPLLHPSPNWDLCLDSWDGCPVVSFQLQHEHWKKPCSFKNNITLTCYCMLLDCFSSQKKKERKFRLFFFKWCCTHWKDTCCRIHLFWNAILCYIGFCPVLTEPWLYDFNFLVFSSTCWSPVVFALLFVILSEKVSETADVMCSNIRNVQQSCKNTNYEKYAPSCHEHDYCNFLGMQNALFFCLRTPR